MKGAVPGTPGGSLFVPGNVAETFFTFFPRGIDKHKALCNDTTMTTNKTAAETAKQEAQTMSSTSRKEVNVRIYLVDANGRMEQRNEAFETSEEAWAWERETRRKEANRRAKADRKMVAASYSYGITVNGNTYGVLLAINGQLIKRDNRDAIEQTGVALVYKRDMEEALDGLRREFRRANG